MTHYFGANAILIRLGFRPNQHLGRLKVIHPGLPGYLRSDPRNSWRKIYYASEQMCLAYELAKSNLETERLKAKEEEKLELA